MKSKMKSQGPPAVPMVSLMVSSKLTVRYGKSIFFFVDDDDKLPPWVFHKLLYTLTPWVFLVLGEIAMAPWCSRSRLDATSSLRHSRHGGSFGGRGFAQSTGPMFPPSRTVYDETRRHGWFMVIPVRW